MSSTVALILMLILYLGVPLILAGIGYKLYQTWKKGRQLTFESMPKLTQITSKNLPPNLASKLQEIDEKAHKLLGYYNNDKGQMADSGIVGENQFLVKKILSTDLPEAVQNFQRLDNVRANEMAVGTTGKTARVLFEEYLNTINEQFDDMLDAMYEQNAQKLLISNRYLQARFDDDNDELNILTRTKPNAVPQLAQPSNGIEIPPPNIKVPETASVKID